MRRRLGFLGLLLAMILPFFAAVPAAAQGGSTMVGTTPVTFNGEWSLSPSSNANIAYLIHTGSQPESAYFYMEIDAATLPIADALYVIEMVILPNFRDSFGVATTPYLAQGGQATETPAPNAWELVSAELPTGSVFVLFAADMNRVPGKAAVEYMIVAPQNLPVALASAQTGITTHGQPNQLAGIDSTAVLSGAGIDPSASVSQQQTPQPPQVPATTPAAVPTPTIAAAAQPGGALTQTATAGLDTIAYGGDWQHSPENSSSDVAFFVLPADDTVVYAYFNGPNNVDAGPIEAVQGATDAFFSDFGAQNLQQLATEELPSGHAWGFTTFERNGVPAAFLIEADVTEPGVARTQFLIAPRDQFTTHLASVQQSFQINGVGAYSEIDVNRVTSLLGGGAPAQQVPAGQTPAPGQTTPTQPAQADPTPAAQTGGGTANYQIEDSPAGCDRIGWVMTDPSQLPVSQADLDARSSCVGGATYAASCGTYLDTGTGVHCTVNVGVGSAPMVVSTQQFTLVDAAGGRHPIDSETMFTHIMLLGGPELPEATVETETTTRGMLIFNVPGDAPTPWVIEIAPDTIATTGEQPGILVIDGPLQPYSVFGQ